MNGLKVFWLGITRGHGMRVSISGTTQNYYKKLTWLSTCLAVSADMAMLLLGGSLKRREMLSARLGDVLSHLYLASCVLKKYEHDGRQQGDLYAVEYALSHPLNEGFKALEYFIDNFANRFCAQILKRWFFLFGHGQKGPRDASIEALCRNVNKDKNARERISHLCVVESSGGIFELEQAYQSLKALKQLRKKVKQWQKERRANDYDKTFENILDEAQASLIITEEEKQSLLDAEVLRQKAIAVDVF
jgi:hypothetical protein